MNVHDHPMAKTLTIRAFDSGNPVEIPLSDEARVTVHESGSLVIESGETVETYSPHAWLHLSETRQASYFRIR